MSEEEKRYTIGETVEQLHSEFPDVTPSSLRFLEKIGLLQPPRTQGGHRLYSDQDIARIRLIKRLQSRRYYPLETIRHMLVRLEQGRDIEAEMAFLESLYTPLSYDAKFVPVGREELAERTGLSTSDIVRLEEIGLLFPTSDANGSPCYDEDDLKVAELVARELRRGAKPGDFAAYAASMRNAMQEEAKLFLNLLGKEPPGPERLRELKETADLVHALQRAKLSRQLMMQIHRTGNEESNDRNDK